MAKITKQVRMVFDLNKCVGCQTCSMACKTMWTDRDEGQMYMYWNNVETQPGRGYPKNWETAGGGFQGNQVDLGGDGDPHVGNLPEIEPDYGAAWEYNYGDVLKTECEPAPEGCAATKSVVVPFPSPDGSDAYASNWDEDVGEGAWPNTQYFYLPRICNHCTKPACLEACPRQSIYKREEDGIVLVDQDRCRGYRYCVAGCPYKKMYYNPMTKKSEKCIFCYPRLENDEGNFCVTQCVGRVRWVGYDNNPAANVNKLVDDWGVGLRLHPEWGTEPNTFYVPPVSAPTYDADGNVTGNQRIPVEQLAAMFGDTQSQNERSRIARIEEIFDILKTERAKVASGGSSELMDILISRSEADRVQLD